MAVFSLGDRRVTFCGEDWYIADSASVIGSVSIGHQTSVWFNVVIRGDNDTITLGDGSNIQDGSVLHADSGIPLTLGRNVTVGHNAMLHGCSIGDGTLIGINSVVMNRSVIGAGSIIGANTLVPEGKTFPDGVLVLGSPGKVVRELTSEERIELLRIAEDYVQRAKLFRNELKTQPIASNHKRRSRR
ncbi:MAG: gamma carbonic anhydrase family protein [Betaproteobacteria bacterium]|nr:gamma carbonic anhydrase family protein [Betaproteobacteria bacterium]